MPARKSGNTGEHLPSIAICTHNRSAQLQQVLADLAEECLSATFPVEVLVILSACTDDSATIVENAARSLPIRAIVETRPGVSIARNRAIAEARLDVILFLDDDVRLRSGWLQAYHDAFADEKVNIVAGRVLAVWPRHRPRWCAGDDAPPFTTIVPHFDLGAVVRDLESTAVIPVTANIGFRTAAIRQLHGFREDLGHLGTVMMGGEDVELIERADAMFGPIRYLPDATVDHPIDSRRLSFVFNLRYLYAGGVALSRYSSPIPTARTLLGAPIWCYREMVRCAGRTLTNVARGRLRDAAIAAGRITTMAGYARGMREASRS